MVCIHQDFEYLLRDRDRRMGCMIRNVDLVYCVGNYRIHHHLYHRNVHILLDRNDNSLRDYYSYILFRKIIYRKMVLIQFRIMTLVTYFCKHLLICQKLVSMVDHCKNLHNPHNLDLWCCEYTRNDHEPCRKYFRHLQVEDTGMRDHSMNMSHELPCLKWHNSIFPKKSYSQKFIKFFGLMSRIKGLKLLKNSCLEISYFYNSCLQDFFNSFTFVYNAKHLDMNNIKYMMRILIIYSIINAIFESTHMYFTPIIQKRITQCMQPRHVNSQICHFQHILNMISIRVVNIHIW